MSSKKSSDKRDQVHKSRATTRPRRSAVVPLGDESATLMQGMEAAGELSTDAANSQVAEATAIGDSAAVRYEEQDEIGRGGMGTVHGVFDRLLRRRIAKKVIQESVASPELTAAFIEEAQITGQLDHPNIVPVYDLGFTGPTGGAFFTMKLVEGRTLEDDIADLHSGGLDSAALSGILRALLKVCEAVSFAHSKGVVHCDLKPANIMIGTHGQVYVMDWGLGLVLSSRRAVSMPATGGESSPRVTTSGSGRGQTPSLAGTVSYMSPEQAAGGVEAIDQRTDVFALGATLYHVLTGRAPYVARISKALEQARSARVVPPEELSDQPLPPALCEIAMKALQRDPAARYQSVDQIRNDLEIFLLGGGWFATRTYAPGEFIIREGDPGDGAYVIIDGQCEVSRWTDQGRQVLRALGPGAVFGEVALLGDNVRTASVTALDRVTVKVITADAFDRELERSSFMSAIVKQLTARFLELERAAAKKPGR